jgi:hypothetical protein
MSETGTLVIISYGMALLLTKLGWYPIDKLKFLCMQHQDLRERRKFALPMQIDYLELGRRKRQKSPLT